MDAQPASTERLAVGVNDAAAMLSLGRMFASDYADGTLEQLVLTPTPPVVWITGKIVAHWLVSGVPLILVAPVLGVQFGLSNEALGVRLIDLLVQLSRHAASPVRAMVPTVMASAAASVSRVTLHDRGLPVLVKLAADVEAAVQRAVVTSLLRVAVVLTDASSRDSISACVQRLLKSDDAAVHLACADSLAAVFSSLDEDFRNEKVLTLLDTLSKANAARKNVKQRSQVLHSLVACFRKLDAVALQPRPVREHLVPSLTQARKQLEMYEPEEKEMLQVVNTLLRRFDGGGATQAM